MKTALLLFAVCLAIYLANTRLVESTDTVGNELLPLSILQHRSLTFDQYFVGPDAAGRYPTGAASCTPASPACGSAHRYTESDPW